MRIAFYAPMKPPTHPVPSGDRRIGRLLIKALRRGGHEVRLASKLRSWDRGIDPANQQRIRSRGSQIADRLIEKWRDDRNRPQAWFTYHLYHKAPDWIGPPIASALGIPYIVAEASHAPKQAEGRWSEGFLAAERALCQATAIFALSEDDASGLRAALGPNAPIHRLPPFLDAGTYVHASHNRTVERARWFPDAGNVPIILAVGMMRAGDKQASYTVLAGAMKRLSGRPWRLALVGFGPETDTILSLFDPDRIRHFGRMDPKEMAGLYAAADLFAWPAVNEAFGMVLLEAQAAGLPVVAGNGRGVPDIVDDGRTGLLTPVGAAEPFARAVEQLLDEPAQRLAMGKAAQRYVLGNHDLSAAVDRLNAVLDPLAS
ncbi:MAG: glycosyltransferase family 4 protein [Pseudomonadota bacterium]